MIKLACAGCGANLEISSTMRRLACTHCGTQQIVERSGGVVQLQAVTEAISKVQAGTDKTAAELAIVRLQNEVQQSLVQRENAWHALDAERRTKMAKWDSAMRANTDGTTWVIAIGGALGFVPALFVTVIVYNIFLYLTGSGAQAGGFGVLLVLAGAVVGAVAAYYWAKKTGKYDSGALAEQRDSEMKMLEAGSDPRWPDTTST